MLSGGSFQVLLLLILVICISIFFFFELRKINLKIISQDMLLNKLTEDLKENVNIPQQNDIEMNNITHELNISKMDSQLNEIPDISGGFSPTTNKEPIYIKPDIKSENTLSEILPLKNDTNNSIKEIETIPSEKIDDYDSSQDDVENESDNESDDSGNSDNGSDSGSDNSSELDIEDIVKELQEMSVKELKNILQEKGLAVSGNKTTMIERIIKSLK